MTKQEIIDIWQRLAQDSTDKIRQKQAAKISKFIVRLLNNEVIQTRRNTYWHHNVPQMIEKLLLKWDEERAISCDDFIIIQTRDKATVEMSGNGVEDFCGWLLGQHPTITSDYSWGWYVTGADGTLD